MPNFTNSPTASEAKSLAGGKQVTPEQLAIAVSKVEKFESDLKEQKGWVIGGYIVLIVAFVGVLFALYAILADYLASNKAEYLYTGSKVDELNQRLENLEKVDDFNFNQRIDNLEERINSKKVPQL